MKDVRCINPGCQVSHRSGNVLKPTLLAKMSSTGTGRVEIKCPRCKQMNMITVGGV